jgi:hypothetical protein
MGPLCVRGCGCSVETGPHQRCGSVGVCERFCVGGKRVVRLIRVVEGDGKFRPTETVLTKWVEESIPASTFDVPAGYKKMEMPTMPPP